MYTRSQAANLSVLGTSAWLTLIEDEAGADIVQTLLERARVGEMVVLTSFMSFMEVYYITLQERGQDEAQERVKFRASLPVLCVASTETLGMSAGRLKADHRLAVATESDDERARRQNLSALGTAALSARGA